MLILNIIATYVARHLVIPGFYACRPDLLTTSKWYALADLKRQRPP